MNSSPQYVCHFTPDDKFIDMVVDDFDLLSVPNRVLVFGSARKLTYVKYPQVEFVSQTEARQVACDEQCVAVIFHSLTGDCLELLKALPASKLVIWLGWGYDYYDLLMRPAYPQGRFQAATQALLAVLHSEKFPGMPGSGVGEIPQGLRDQLNKIDYFACLDTEYALIRQYHPWFAPKLFWPWGYGHAEGNGRGAGADILVGNSASPENNHLDVFRYLHEQIDIRGRQIVVPLSYGDMTYREKIIAAGRDLFGEAFQPQLGYMERQAYFETLSSCGFVFMNHSRQQAVGNISSALLSGARLFMNASSPLYQLLKGGGAFVNCMGDHPGALMPLSVEQRLTNQKVILDTWGRDAHRRQVIALALLIQQRIEPEKEVSSARQTEGQASTLAGTPFFSVVMPVYNRERYVEEAINSVLSQSCTDFELIVVDDGSTDRSLDIVGKFDDPRLHLFRNTHGGGAAARNTGIEAARGEFIVWIDSDDRQAPGALSALRQAMQECPEADVYYGDLQIFDEAHPGQLRHTEYPDYHGESLLPRLIRANCLPNPGTAVRRSLYQRYGGYDLNFRRCHDFQMWTRLADSARFKKVEKVLCHWRQHDESLSSAKTRTFEAKVALDMLERYPPSRLFTGLADDPSGQGEACWRVSRTLEALAEPGMALRTAYRAQALGVGDSERIQALLRAAGSAYEPSFSVVLTTFNRPQLLLDALASLDGQSFRDFEAILVNDHGEGVEGLLSEFAFPITYLRQGCNLGPAAARNAAHRLARGRYVVYLDDDDIFLPEHLQTLAEAIALHPGEVVYSDALFVVERIDNGVRHVLQEEQRYAHGNYSRERLLVDNYIPVNTFAWPREIGAEIGGFDERLSGLEDWDFLLRLAARLPFHHVQKETAQVRMRASDAVPDRRSQQALKNYPQLYQELYSRHSDLGVEQVRTQREAKLRQLGGAFSVSPGDALRDWLEARKPTPAQQSLIDQYLSGHLGGPSIGVLVLDTVGDFDAVTHTLSSLQEDRQSYRNVRAYAFTVGDFGADHFAEGVLRKVEPDSLIQTINQTLIELDCEWCLLVRAGERFTCSGLLVAALELVVAPECRAIYTDEMQLTARGDLLPILRPDFNLDLLLSFPSSMSKHWLFRRDVLLAAGGFDVDYAEALEFELVLRLIEQGGLSGLGHVAEPLLVGEALALEENSDEQRALSRHLNARGYTQPVVESTMPGRYRIRYGHDGQPGVSIIIPAIGPAARLQRCVESVLETVQDIPFEILLLRQPGQEIAVGTWLAGLEQLGESNLRVLDAAAGLSLAAGQNLAAGLARGDYLLFLAADTVAVQPDWLASLLNHAQRPEVAAVGGRLLSPEGTIRHAGLILGLKGDVASPFEGDALDAAGYMNRLEVDQNYSAVSGDCLLIARQIFDQLTGFDEASVAARWVDVDLCLRARQAGYLTVWTPHATLMKESAREPLGVAEQDELFSRWLPILARDSAYNPNLSLQRPGGFKLTDLQLSWRPLMAWRPLPVVLAHPADQYGCGHYRVMQPFMALEQAGMVDGTLSSGLMHVVDLERYDPDVIVLQRQISEERLEAMRRMQAFSRAFKVYELDDYLPNLPMKSQHRERMPKDILRSLRRGLSYVDRFVVSTQPLAEALADLHADVRVVENRLPVQWWKELPTPASRSPRARPRVGWAGGSSHRGDLEMIKDVIVELAGEVDWILFGMCPDSIRPYVAEFHKGVAIENYPAALARLDLDLAVAPVEQNLFNECKSNLRLLEYGACGYPVICSDVRCYQAGLPVTRVKNRYRDWVDAIRMHLADPAANVAAGQALHQRVQRDWMLAGVHLESWLQAWSGN